MMGSSCQCWIAAIVAIAVAMLPDVAMAWPSVPLPENSRGEMVSEEMSYNGLQMRASKFSTPLKMDAVIAFYARTWGEGKHVVTPNGGKVIIGRSEPGYYVTVEVAPGGSGTVGTVGIVKEPGKGAKPDLGSDFYRPAGTEVVSDIKHLDTPGKTRTIVLRNRLAPYANLQLYSNRLSAEGWRGAATGRCVPSSSDCLIQYERAGGGKLAMTLSRDDERVTTLVVNIE